MTTDYVEVPTPPGHTLEARFCRGSPSDAAIICHPHPLYGGDMHNNVVSAAWDAARSLGFSTMKFNFRGVGASGGYHSGSTDEVEDLLAVEHALAGFLGNPAHRLHLLAYSWGSWIATLAARELRPSSMVLVAPPLDFLCFDGMVLPPCPALLILGQRDHYCAEQSLLGWLKSQPPCQAPRQRVLLKGADHYFGGFQSRLESEIRNFLHH